MKNLYVFYDTVSGNFGDVVEADNDLVMRRSAVRALASVPPEISHDTVVLQVGSVSSDDDGLPLVVPCVPVRTAFSGSSPAVEEFRAQLMEEARQFASFSGGDSDAE